MLQQREQIVDIWHKCLLGNEIGYAKFDWFYTDCPWGPPLIQLLRYLPNDEIVGIAAVGRRRMLWQGREICAGVFGDVAVLPEHRSFGPARRLLKSLFERSRESLDLVYGMPNPKAAALLQRATYTRIGDISRYACVLRHRRYLATRMPALLAAPLALVLDAVHDSLRRLRESGSMPLQAQWTDHADVRFDALWARSDHGNALVQVHDTAMARWRFDAFPSQKTRYLLLVNQSTDRLLAWFACRDEGSILHIDDFWSEDAAEGISRQTICALLRAARADGCDAISLAFAGSNETVHGWLQAGFRKRSQRPIFGLRNDASSVPGDIHLTAGDEDQ